MLIAGHVFAGPEIEVKPSRAGVNGLQKGRRLRVDGQIVDASVEYMIQWKHLTAVNNRRRGQRSGEH